MESRIVGQLLACMDDLNTKGNEKEGQVVVIGATNRPGMISYAAYFCGDVQDWDSSRLNSSILAFEMKIADNTDNSKVNFSLVF